jgi:2-polyprenyl-6-methoxyphenol hydroxylase-like FAD-dependent oxidoreductase
MSVSTVLVVVGGITGSMLALALADRGVQVGLVEISPVWHGVGHGITVQGNALAAFDQVGVLAEMQTLGIAFNQMRMLHADGSLIAAVPTPRTGGRGLPATMGALRSDLQAVLCERAYQAGVRVRLGLTVRGLNVAAGDVEFSDGSTGSYDLVVGADGIRSAVRSLLDIATEPQRSGMSIWRVAAPRPAELDCAEVYYGGPRFKAGYSPISADRCYAYLLDEDDAADTGRPMWEQLHEGSQGYGGTWGKIRTTIGPDSEFSYTRIEWLLVDSPRYRGKAIVIGDAAHACPPLIAQGAAMCAEDAVVLAELETGPGPVTDALRAFMARRHGHLLVPEANALAASSPGQAADEASERESFSADSLAVNAEQIRRVWPQLTSVGRRLADRNSIGVDVQVVGSMPMHRYWAEPDLAVALSRTTNEAVAGHCAQGRGRLRGIRDAAVAASAGRGGRTGVRRAGPRSGRHQRVDQRQRARAGRPAARSDMGGRRWSWRGGLHPPVGLLARLPAGRALPRQQLRAAGRDRAGAGAPDLRRHAGPVPWPKAPGRARGRLPAYLPGPIRSRVADQARCTQLRRAAEFVPAPDLVRLAGLHPGGAAASGRGGRSRPGGARDRLSVRHGDHRSR